uniref:Complement C1s subcomponent-like n=1 Tax=Astyanax mexicanus TaxID=7994 RepID=A0A8B9LGU6_ASTMX
MSRIKRIVSLWMLWMSVCECKESKYGHVQSPLYPEPYPVGLYMQWYLKVPLGYQIQLTFNHLDIESFANCSKDSLTVLHDNEVWGKFCGQTSTDPHHPGKNPIMSPSNHVQLVFETDESRPQMHLGFFVFYEAVVVDCGIPDLPDLVALTEENPLTTYKQNITFKCSSIFYQLVGHANFTCDASGNWVSESGQNLYQNAPQCVPECGMNEEFFPRGRVFGGERAKLKQIPWQLLMKEPKRGGASLISDRWALTAAHFVDGHETKKMKFYGGMIDGKDRNAVIMETEKIIIHPDYERDVSGRKRSTFDNDIALVKMSARVPLSLKIRPVCLPEKSAGPVMKGGTGTVSGYGMTEIKTASRFLQYAHLQEYSEFPCFQSPMKVTDNMFCAGGEMVDSCKGDGGGPLVLPMLGTGSPNKPYRLEGIVSWGPPRCGNKDFKGYYTKVQNYLDWIRETMQKN